MIEYRIRKLKKGFNVHARKDGVKWTNVIKVSTEMEADLVVVSCQLAQLDPSDINIAYAAAVDLIRKYEDRAKATCSPEKVLAEGKRLHNIFNKRLDVVNAKVRVSTIIKDIRSRIVDIGDTHRKSEQQ